MPESYPLPAHAATIWLRADGSISLALPPSPGNSRAHTVTLPGDAGGLQNSATAGSFYISLHTADPDEAGDLTRFGGQYESPTPGADIHPTEFGARFAPKRAGMVDPEALKPVAPGALAAQPVAARPVASGFSPEALDDLVAKQGGVQKPVQVFDDAGNAVPVEMPKGSQPSKANAGFAAQVTAAAERAGGRKVLIRDLYEDPAFDGMTFKEFKQNLVDAQKRGEVNLARVDLAGWLAEAQQEAINDRARLGVVWFKRRGKSSPGDGYVLMDGETFVGLIKEAGY